MRYLHCQSTSVSHALPLDSDEQYEGAAQALKASRPSRRYHTIPATTSTASGLSRSIVARASAYHLYYAVRFHCFVASCVHLGDECAPTVERVSLKWKCTRCTPAKLAMPLVHHSAAWSRQITPCELQANQKFDASARETVKLQYQAASYATVDRPLQPRKTKPTKTSTSQEL